MSHLENFFQENVYFVALCIVTSSLFLIIFISLTVFDGKPDEQQKIGTVLGKTSWQATNSYNPRNKSIQNTSKTSFSSSQNASQTYHHQKELSQEIQRVANSTSQMNQSSPHFYLPGQLSTSCIYQE